MNRKKKINKKCCNTTQCFKCPLKHLDIIYCAYARNCRDIDFKDVIKIVNEELEE